MLDYRIEKSARLRDRAQLPDRYAGLRAPEALEYPACTKLLGPLVPGMTIERGAKVPWGHPINSIRLQAAFNIGTMNPLGSISTNTWLAAEWGHPSDNLGAILARRRLAVAQRQTASDARRADGDDQAHEIQGVNRA